MLFGYFQAPYNTVYYEITGSSEASQFFSIDKDDGEVRLKRSLLQDLNMAESYRVSLLLHCMQMSGLNHTTYLF